MLGKLLKYEFRATGRVLLPIYGVLIVITAVDKGLMLFMGIERFEGNPLLKVALGLLTTVSVLMMLALAIGTLFLVIQRFYKNLFSGEGYLSFTLPATPAQHLNAKLISAFVWILASGIIMVGAVFLLVVNDEMIRFLPDIKGQFSTLVRTAPKGFWLLMVELFVVLIVTVLQSILQFYASIAIGQRIMPEKRILGAIVSYFGIQVLLQIITFATLVIIAVSGMLSSGGMIERMLSTDSGIPTMHLAMLYTLGISLATGAAYYIITHATMKKHLNLE